MNNKTCVVQLSRDNYDDQYKNRDVMYESIDDCEDRDNQYIIYQDPYNDRHFNNPPRQKRQVNQGQYDEMAIKTLNKRTNNEYYFVKENGYPKDRYNQDYGQNKNTNFYPNNQEGRYEDIKYDKYGYEKPRLNSSFDMSQPNLKAKNMSPNQMRNAYLRDAQKKYSYNQEQYRESQANHSNGYIRSMKVSTANSNYNQIPTFYKQEIRRSLFLFIFWIIATLGVYAGIGVGIYDILNSNESPYLCLILIAPFLIVTGFLILYTEKYRGIHKEAMTVDFSNYRVVTVNIQKLYTRLKTGYLNINWFSATIYLYSLLTILIVFIVGSINSINGVFGDLKPSNFEPNNPVYSIILWSSVAGIALMFISQITVIFTNKIRINKIDNFYGNEIIPASDIEIVRKKKNRRNMILFFVSTLVFAIIGFIIVKLVKTSTNSTKK